MKIVCFNKIDVQDEFKICGKVVIENFDFGVHDLKIACPKCGGVNTIDGVADDWKPSNIGLTSD